MSIFGIFDIGKNALFAAQTALTVTNNNIANVNTPGYTRQSVVLEVADPVSIRGGFLGRGAKVTGVRRDYDRFIEAQLLGQRQNTGRSQVLDQSLSQVEQVFNEAAGMGLSRPLSEYFAAWNEVATNPEGPTQRSLLLQKAQALVTAAQRMERGTLDTIRQANEEVADIANRINEIAADIVSLNVKITQIEAGAGNRTANDLRDQRGGLLGELAALTDFSSYEDQYGEITVSIGMRNLVAGETKNTLYAPVGTDGNRQLYLDGINITGNIQNGKLDGLLKIRDDIDLNTLTPIRRVIASITREVNLLHQAGFGLDGSTGNDFFTPLTAATRDESSGADITASITDLTQVTLDEYLVTFDAGGNYFVSTRDAGTPVTSGVYVSGAPVTVNGITFTITGAVTQNDRFLVSPLTDAITNFGVAMSDPRQVAASSSALELPGNNAVALQVAGLTDASVVNLGDKSFSAYYRGVVSNVGTMSRAASDGLAFDENLLAELQKRRESVAGVSLDEEAANLIRYQRSYEAAARMIRVADEVLQTLLSL